jgi:predicted nuclease of predicted toxin-antitoxin system
VKILLDNGLPRGAVALLRDSGLDASHVGDFSLSRASDLQILDFAEQGNYCVVTLDADFHTLLAMRGASRPSVIRLRIEGLKAFDVANLLAPLIRRFERELRAGAVISVGRLTARCRLLPF